MGLIYGDILNIPRCMATRILACLKTMITMARTHLGLHKHSPNMGLEDGGSDSESERSPNYILVMDSMCPTPVPIPVHVMTAFIRKRLPVVEFAQICKRFGDDHDQTDMVELESVCSICLDCIEQKDEIRDLPNCHHIFHSHCLDCWLDQGQVTCPLCRSMLFPAASGHRTIFQEIHCMNINN